MSVMPSHPIRHLDEMLPWNDKLQMLECISAVEEAPDVMTFSFRTPDQNWFRYAPGQFVTLELPVSPEPVMRTYTLSSTPSRPYSIAVTVKAQQGSVGTRWMLDHLRPGMRIRAYGPAGDFSLASRPAEKYLFISAGSGITPMMSMTRWLHDCAPSTDTIFINCARRPDEIIFHDELRLLASRMEALKLAFIVGRSLPRHGWSGLHGRIDRARLELIAPDIHHRTVFCCGPEPFMRAMREALQAMGFDMARYHQESFQPAAETVGTPPSPASGPETAAQAATVRFTRSGVETACAADDTILLAARSAGLKIPSACEFGVCGTCKVLCSGGETVMNHNGGIRDDEIAEGYVLACCTRPVGPVEIDA